MDTMASEAKATISEPRRCTCHPDDNPPVPCQRKYALTECRTAELIEAAQDCIRDYFIASGLVPTDEGDGYGSLRRLRLALKALGHD